MTWARPDLLALLLLVPVVLVGMVLVERARWRVLAAIAALDVLPSILPPRLRKIRAWQALLTVATTLALALAAAGPRLGFEWQQQKVEGVSIVVLLDVSRSMDAADVTPSRSERARREILDLVGLLRGDAVGLVVFAAGPYVRIPLTVDYDTFIWAVEDSSSATIRAQGSALAGGLEAATGLLEKADGSGKAIVLVSDGESHDEPGEIDKAVERARAAGVHVYALGVGETGGAPIPVPEGGFKKDTAGNVVLSHLDEEVLQRVAAATGGAYVRAVASDDDIRALYQTEIRGKLGASERGIRREKLWHERFQWPLGLALVTMVATSALGVGRLRAPVRAAAALLAVGLLLAAPGTARAGAADEGQAALRAKDWDRAAALLGQARVEDPGDLEATRGLAEALYRSGREREAEQLFRTLSQQDPQNEAVYRYNAGNAAYRGGRLAQALEDFQAAAKADPALAAATKNATAVQKEIAARTEPPPPKEDEGDKGDQNQDGQADEGQQGSPQQGEQGEQGQPSDSDAAKPQDAQSGDPSDAKGQDGQSEGSEEQPSDSQPGSGKPPESDGKRTPTADGQPPGSESDAAGEGDPLSAVGDEDGTPAKEEGDGPSQGTGEMTAQEAARLVDSVPDGTPRVVVSGRGTEKDW